MMTTNLRAIFVDCGDTLIDESTELKTPEGVSLGAELIPGAGDLMHQLKQRGYPLALVADGFAESFINNLRPQDVYQVFDVYAVSEILGIEKPHPDIFNYALNQLHIDPADYGKVLMFGNNLERDIKGANLLGLISVWLDWSPRRSKIPADDSEVPQFTIKQPLELLNIIDLLEQRFDSTKT